MYVPSHPLPLFLCVQQNRTESIILFVACFVVARIQMTRPQLSRQVQSILLRMAQGGQLRGKVSDEQLVGLLEQAERAGGGGGGGGGGGAPSKIIVSLLTGEMKGGSTGRGASFTCGRGRDSFCV